MDITAEYSNHEEENQVHILTKEILFLKNF